MDFWSNLENVCIKYINIYIIYSCCKTSVLKVVFDKKKKIWCIFFCMHLYNWPVSLIAPIRRSFFHVFCIDSAGRVDIHFWMREENLSESQSNRCWLFPITRLPKPGKVVLKSVNLIVFVFYCFLFSNFALCVNAILLAQKKCCQ